MAPSAAIGISAASRPKNRVMSKRVAAWVIPATGVRPPLRMFVAVRAMAPVAGIPPNSGATTLAAPCATSSRFDLWRVPIMPSATTAESNDSTAPSRAMDRGLHQRGDLSEAEVRDDRVREVRADLAEPAADRLDGKMKEAGGDGRRDQGDERTGDPMAHPGPQPHHDDRGPSERQG